MKLITFIFALCINFTLSDKRKSSRGNFYLYDPKDNLFTALDADPQEYQKLKEFVRRQRQIRFKTTYQELPAGLQAAMDQMKPMNVHQQEESSYFVYDDVRAPKESSALNIIPLSDTYFPPQIDPNLIPKDIPTTPTLTTVKPFSKILEAPIQNSINRAKAFSSSSKNAITKPNNFLTLPSRSNLNQKIPEISRHLQPPLLPFVEINSTTTILPLLSNSIDDLSKSLLNSSPNITNIDKIPIKDNKQTTLSINKLNPTKSFTSNFSKSMKQLSNWSKVLKSDKNSSNRIKIENVTTKPSKNFANPSKANQNALTAPRVSHPKNIKFHISTPINQLNHVFPSSSIPDVKFSATRPVAKIIQLKPPRKSTSIKISEPKNSNQFTFTKSSSNTIKNGKSLNIDKQVGVKRGRGRFYGSIPGQPDIDYPTFVTIPDTSFRCTDMSKAGYYADVEANCQVFHACWGKQKASFLCPVGTIFSHQVLTCDWWYKSKCSNDEITTNYQPDWGVPISNDT